MYPSHYSITNGRYVGEHSFTAINNLNTCTKDSNCYGWSMEGKYSVTTSARGETEITMRVNVHNPNNFNTSSVFGMGWGFSYDNKGTPKSETYHTVWDYDSFFKHKRWITSMHTFDRPLEAIMP